MKEADQPRSHSGIGTSALPGHKNLKENHVERELDEALMETFPASDPLPIDSKKDDDTKIDKALKDTFPGSDPAAIQTPKKN